MNSDEQLAQALAEMPAIFLPASVSWWPPAPGWWLLGLLVIMLAAWLASIALKMFKRQRPIRLAMREINRLITDAEKFDRTASQNQATLTHLSTLLRQISNQYFVQPLVSVQSGNAWLNALDSLIDAPSPIMNDSTGATFIKLYSLEPVNKQELLAVLRTSKRWLKLAGKINPREIKTKRKEKNVAASSIMLDKQQV